MGRRRCISGEPGHKWGAPAGEPIGHALQSGIPLQKSGPCPLRNDGQIPSSWSAVDGLRQGGLPMTAPSDGSAVKLAPVDIEAGKTRTGLRPGAPVNARRIDHVNISVRDLDVSAAFYAALFGLEVKEEGISFGGRWCIIGSPDRFYLCLFEGHGADRSERYKAGRRPYRPCWIGRRRHRRDR